MRCPERHYYKSYLILMNYSVKYVADNIEQKKYAIDIFLDLSKTFDTIENFIEAVICK